MSKEVEIIPAVLPKSFADLEAHVALINGVARQVQVDVVDGEYAKGRTWPYRDHTTFDKIVQEERGLPHWETVDYQFDLMIQHPETELKKYLSAGATQIILHAKSEGVEEAVRYMVDHRGEMGTYAVRSGVALDAHAQPEDIDRFEGQYDFVQVMGIEHEGKQGEPFDPDHKALYLIERIRTRYPELPIQVDGGVTLENATRLVAAGATRLVAGSAVFGADDPAAAYKTLYNMVNAH